MTHICVGKLSIIGSDNGLSPGQRQAIIWTNAGILLIGPLEINFSENSIEILTFSFMKMRLKVASAKWRPFCLGLNVLMMWQLWECHLLPNSVPCYISCRHWFPTWNILNTAVWDQVKWDISIFEGCWKITELVKGQGILQSILKPLNFQRFLFTSWVFWC